jgi:hypothetical protein
VNFDSKLLKKFNFPECFFNWRSILWNFIRDNATTSVILLVDMNVLITKSCKEGSATDGTRSCSYESNWFLIRRGKVSCNGWISYLSNSHLLKDSHSELLQAVNLNSSLLFLRNVTIFGAEFADRAKLTACKT